MKRVLFTLAFSGVVSLSLMTAPQARTQSPERTLIEQALTEAGITPSRIEKVDIVAERGGGQANSIQGFQAWVTVSGCDRSIIVSTGWHGGVDDIYIPSACGF